MYIEGDGSGLSRLHSERPTKAQLMLLPDLNELFDQYNEEYFAPRGIRITKIPIEWNTRLRTTAGRCHFDYKRGRVVPSKIDMNLALFQKHDFDADKLRTTLIHEMVHAALCEHYNDREHSPHFHRLMSRITGEWKNHRLHSYDTQGLREERLIEAHCDGGCGVIAKRARMPRKGYHCGKCKSPITWVDNRPARKPKSAGVKLFG